MIKKIIIALIILALGVAGNLWLNKDNAPSRRPSSQTAAGNQRPATESNTPRPAPTSDNADKAKSADSKPQAQTRDGNTANQNQRPPRGGPGGMRGGTLAQQSSTSVEVMRPMAKQQHASLTVYGMINAQTSTTLKASSSATVTGLKAIEGESVKQGQVLAELRADNTVEQLRQRQSSLAELDARIRSEALKHKNDLAALEIEQELVRIAKNSVDRFTSLNTQQLSSSTDYESSLRNYQSQLLSLQNRQLTLAQYDDTQTQLQAQREQLQSQIRQSQELVDDLIITAPFSGLLAQLNVTLGQEINNGELIAEIYDPASLVLYTRVPVRYRLDQTELSNIQATDSNGQPWQATAIRPINEAGAQRLTLTPLTNETLHPLPGSYVSLTLNYPMTEPTIDVPTTAVYDQQRVYVFNPQNQSIQAVPVSIVGRSTEGYLISAQSFTTPAPIITTRLKNPVSGMTVSIVRPNRGDRS